MPGSGSFGVVEVIDFAAAGGTAVVRERLRVLTPAVSFSSPCAFVDEADVEEPRALLDFAAHS